jgi:N6-adenosine-specific RNA methylase IME4
MSETALFHFTQARQALQKAKTIDEVKIVRDAAERLRLYLRQTNESLEMQNDAAEIGLRAERRAGEMLKEGAENGDRARPGDYNKSNGYGLDSNTVLPSKPATLSEIGISKIQSSRWQAMANIPEAEFENAIGQAKIAGQELTRSMLHKVAKDQQQAERREERIAKVADPLNTVGRFPVIYADPPWQYDFISVDAWKVENHYPTMAIDEICALPVADIATEDAILFLWATAPKLADAMRVVTSWGFTYKTCAIWDKEWTGMGNYFRIQHELLLIATRGSIPPPTTDNRPASIVQHKRSTTHSQKPDVFYDIIESMYPELPKVELFARSTREKWKSWGNQVEGEKGK